jgi:hypothetical protein
MKARNGAGAKGAQEGGDVNDQTTGNKAKKVSDWWTKQFEEAQAEIERYLHWSWVEPAVWTTRMLTTLEKGIKGGKWFSLIDKVYALPNLMAAFTKVKVNKGAAGVDHRTIETYENIVITTSLARQIAGFGCDSEAFCDADKGDADMDVVAIIDDGQMPTLKRTGCSR